MNIPLKSTPPHSPQAMPEDIRPKWFSVIRAIQAKISQCDNKGLAVVTLNILIDAQGNPVAWNEPALSKIHPQRSAKEILDLIVKSL